MYEEKLTDKLLLQNAALNEAKKHVEQIADKLVNFLSKPKLLCQLSFQQILSLEENYTAKLTSHANQEFEQVIEP